MRRRTFLIAASGAAGLALAGRLRATPARAAPAADQKTLIMAPNFVIRSLDPGHTLEPDGEMVTHACYDALVTFEGADLSTPKPHLATTLRASTSPESGLYVSTSTGSFWLTILPIFSCDPSASVTRVP